MSTEDWRGMVSFAKELVEHARKHKTENIIDQRISIVHLHHATELLMKAYLIKEGYIINEVKKTVGIKKNAEIQEILNKKKTIRFEETLNLVSKKISLGDSNKNIIREFGYLRNEINHRATDLNINKEQRITQFIPVLEEIYNKMFPEDEGNLPSFFGR